jgi:S-adenosylmethionine decarboxylase
MHAKTIGCEWVIDAFHCVPDRLRDLSALQGICDRIIQELQLHVVGQPTWHQFPGEAGVTGLYLLSESHLACHTYPEVEMATFNLYCCRSIPEWPWEETLQRELGAASCTVIRIPRGLRAPRGDAVHREGQAEVSTRQAVPWESVP